MWNWLINMLVKAPLPPPCCSCSETRNKKLRQMQQAIEKEELPEGENLSEAAFSPIGRLHTECTIRISGHRQTDDSAES